MPTLDDKARVEIEQAISARKKIEAIKLYREAVPGTDLVDAKKAVEDLEAQLRREKPENFGPPSSKSGCLGLLVGLAALAGSVGVMAVVGIMWN